VGDGSVVIIEYVLSASFVDGNGTR